MYLYEKIKSPTILEGIPKDPMALPRVNTGIVAARAIRITIIAFDFTVKPRQYIMPSFETTSGPICTRDSPFIVKGIKSHKNIIKRFAKRIRISTVFNGSLAKAINANEITRPQKRVKNLTERAITNEKINAEIIFTLGSSL
jgi:hypothetical protein